MKLRFRDIETPQTMALSLKLSPKRKAAEMDELKDYCLDRSPIDIGERVVTVRVGPSQDCFQIHKNLLTTSSGFFRAALDQKHGFRESQSGTVNLPEESAHLFRTFVNYVYFSKVLVDMPTTNEEAKYAMDNLIEEYILAQKLQAQCFQDNVINAMLAILRIKIGEKMYNYFDAEQIRTIYAHTSPSCPLRQLCVDQYTFLGTIEWFHDTTSEDMPSEFMLALAKALLIHRPTPKGKAPFVDTSSRYHGESFAEA